MIDNTSCLNAVNTIKRHISDCFSECTTKGSTFRGSEKLSNLKEAISLIPTEGGTVSEGVTGGSFNLFTVTKPDEPTTEEFTIDFGSVGVTWTSIICYSDTKDGHFSIQKITGNKCIISASVFYNAENVWDEAFGIFPEVRGTYRATYSISGNTIRFINDEYDGTSNGFDTYDVFASMPNQVSNAVNDYFTDQYKLDKITVCV